MTKDSCLNCGSEAFLEKESKVLFETPLEIGCTIIYTKNIQYDKEKGFVCLVCGNVMTYEEFILRREKRKEIEN